MYAPDTIDTSQVLQAPASTPAKPPEPQPSYDENGVFSPHSFTVNFIWQILLGKSSWEINLALF